MGTLQKFTAERWKFPEYDHTRSLELLKADMNDPKNSTEKQKAKTTNKPEVLSTFERDLLPNKPTPDWKGRQLLKISLDPWG